MVLALGPDRDLCRDCKHIMHAGACSFCVNMSAPQQAHVGREEEAVADRTPSGTLQAGPDLIYEEDSPFRAWNGRAWV